MVATTTDRPEDQMDIAERESSTTRRLERTREVLGINHRPTHVVEETEGGLPPTPTDRQVDRENRRSV